MNYIALGIISDIDNLYTEVHQDETHKIVVSQDEWAPVVFDPN